MEEEIKFLCTSEVKNYRLKNFEKQGIKLYLTCLFKKEKNKAMKYF